MVVHNRLGISAGMGAAFLALGEQREIHRAALIFSEAVFQRVAEMIEGKIFATASIGTVEKRTMLATFGHNSSPAPLANIVLSAIARNVREYGELLTVR
jgi:hypothetical protein